MKKILFLLLTTVSIYGQTLQNPTFGTVKIKNNTTSATATKVNVQEADGVINTILKSDLIDVVEVNDVPSLPLVGNAGKIYVVKNLNKIYRWNGTFYQELTTDISGKEDVANKQNSLAIDGTNTKYPTVTAVNAEVVKLTGVQTITGQKTFNNSTTGSGIVSNNSSTGSGIYSINSSTGSGIISINSSGGGGIIASNSSVGVGILSSSSSTGNSIISRQTDTGSGFNYVGQNNLTNTFTVDKLGTTRATSFIKSSSPATNILLAGGGDIAQNTAFNKPFGTTAGTVVEGGTLGSNAYTSTAYLPLSGGALSGNLTVYKTSGLSNLATRVGEVYGYFYNNGVDIGLGSHVGSTGYKLKINYTSPDNSLTIDSNGKSKFISTVEATSYTATSLPVFENNAAASSLAVGQFYRTSTGVLMVKF